MKCLLKFVAICVLGVLLLVGAAVFGLESILTEAMRTGVAHATGQETAVDGVDVGYSDRALGFRGLEIANPPGFQAAPMFRVGTIRAQMATEMVRGNVVLLDEVLLDGLELSFELKGSDSNVQVLMDHLAQMQGTDAAPAEPANPTEPAPSQPQSEPTEPAPQLDPSIAAEPETQFIIGRAQISGVKVSLHISDVPGISGQYSLSIPTILLQDLDSTHGEAALEQWVAVFAETVLQQALDAGKGVFPGEWQALLEGDLAQSLLKGDLKAAEDVLKDKAEAKLDKLLEKADSAEELIKQGDALIKESGISNKATESLQEELKKASDLRKNFFDKD